MQTCPLNSRHSQAVISRENFLSAYSHPFAGASLFRSGHSHIHIERACIEHACEAAMAQERMGYLGNVVPRLPLAALVQKRTNAAVVGLSVKSISKRAPTRIVALRPSSKLNSRRCLLWTGAMRSGYRLESY